MSSPILLAVVSADATEGVVITGVATPTTAAFDGDALEGKAVVEREGEEEENEEGKGEEILKAANSVLPDFPTEREVTISDLNRSSVVCTAGSTP